MDEREILINNDINDKLNFKIEEVKQLNKIIFNDID